MSTAKATTSLNDSGLKPSTILASQSPDKTGPLDPDNSADPCLLASRELPVRRPDLSLRNPLLREPLNWST